MLARKRRTIDFGKQKALKWACRIKDAEAFRICQDNRFQLDQADSHLDRQCGCWASPSCRTKHLDSGTHFPADDVLFDFSHTGPSCATQELLLQAVEGKSRLRQNFEFSGHPTALYHILSLLSDIILCFVVPGRL